MYGQKVSLVYFCCIALQNALLAFLSLSKFWLQTILDLRRMDRPCKAQKGNKASESTKTVIKYLLLVDVHPNHTVSSIFMTSRSCVVSEQESSAFHLCSGFSTSDPKPITSMHWHHTTL